MKKRTFLIAALGFLALGSMLYAADEYVVNHVVGEHCIETYPHTAAEIAALEPSPRAGMRYYSSEIDDYLFNDGSGWRRLKNLSEPMDWDAVAGGESPAEVELGDMVSFEFRDGFEESTTGNMQVPLAIDLTINPVLVIQFGVTKAGDASQAVQLRLNIKYIAEGELATKANDESLLHTVDITNTLEAIHTEEFTLDRTKIAVNDRISFRLTRLDNADPDTFTGDIAIIELGRFDFN